MKRSESARGTANVATGVELWHRRLGQIPAAKRMAKHSEGIYPNNKPDDPDCIDCVEGKRKNGSSSGTLVKGNMEVARTVYNDLFGPFSARSWGKSKYLLRSPR